jgi:hypothetical protein
MRISSTSSHISSTRVGATGNVIASLRMRMPAPSSSSRLSPHASSAPSTSRYVLPAQTMPSRAGPAAPTTRSRPRAVTHPCAARRRRSSHSSPRSLRRIWPVGSWVQGRPSTSTAGSPARKRSMPVSTAPMPSATAVTMRIPTQEPQKRLRRNASMPRSKRSCWSAGTSTGAAASARARLVSYGRVDDLADGSSPTNSTAPPPGPVPIRLACFNTSPERSSPGPLLYQAPLLPDPPPIRVSGQ